MAVNKVSYGGNTLIDLTDATATADKILSPFTAYDRSGTKITGSLSVVTYYTGSTAPSSSLGQDGDIYLQE